MSLEIDIDRVTAVLLADGWHTVAGDSFEIDSYEYIWPSGMGPNNNTVASDGVGFGFTADDGGVLYGPLSAVLAVKYRESA